MAWVQASVLAALVVVCTGQYSFDNTAGFEPFTNFEQYAQTRGRTTNGGFRPSSQSFASPTGSDGNYDSSRSFNFVRESLNGNPISSRSADPSQELQANRYSFDEGRQVPDVSANGFRIPSSSYTQTTERPRYYEPTAVTYQPNSIQAPTYQAPPYQPHVAPRYQVPTPAPQYPPTASQYSPPASQYSPPASQYVAPQAPQYRPQPALAQYEPPPQPRQYPTPQVEAPVHRPTPRPYQPPVQQTYQTPPRQEEPNRPAKNAAAVSSRSSNEVSEKPSVVHPAAPVHYVSIGQKLEGDYKFGYDTGKASNGDESFRRETRDPDGTVRGSYGYVDSNGKQIVVHYEAGKEGYKVLSESEAKQRAERAQRVAAQPQPAAQAPVQQYRPPVQQALQTVQPQEPPQRRVRRIKKKRRERRAVEEEDAPQEKIAKEDFGSRVSGTGSLRPTGAPRVRPGRTRRPLNPDGRSLQPTESPVRQRNFRRKVVVRTTTPLPRPSARPTVPRRQIIPSIPTSTPASFEEPVTQPQPKRRRKVRRKFRTTVAPELQQLQAPDPQAPSSPPTSPAAPRGQTGQLPANVLPPTFLQSPVSNQTHFLNSYNNIQTHTNNPYVQHVNSPQSLYEQLTSSIYQEAGRVSPSRNFIAQPQYSSQQYQPAFQNIQYGSANFQPQFGNTQSHYNQLPQYQQSSYQFPQQQFQQSRFFPRYAHPQSQDLYSHPSNIEYSRNLLSYDIGAAQ